MNWLNNDPNWQAWTADSGAGEPYGATHARQYVGGKARG
jgi:hypothetical protein